LIPDGIHDLLAVSLCRRFGLRHIAEWALLREQKGFGEQNSYSDADTKYDERRGDGIIFDGFHWIAQHVPGALHGARLLAVLLWSVLLGSLSNHDLSFEFVVHESFLSLKSSLGRCFDRNPDSEVQLSAHRQGEKNADSHASGKTDR